MTDDGTRVEWRDWGRAAFDEADEAGKPVLLALTATWCDGCHEMDAETYADPRIAANVNDGFVPIRVDVDRHPRVRERYNMGGFPSTVFTTPAGEVITGAGYLDPESFRGILDRVREVWDAKGASAGRVPRALGDEPTPAGEVTPQIEEYVAGQLDRQFDQKFAGWGTDAKFPLPRTVEFALKRDREQALRTLDAIRDHLHDSVAGGFFRYADSRSWGGIHYEKVADLNASLLRTFAHAYCYTGEDAYRDPARRTVRYLTDDLWSGVAVGGSEGPGEGRDYYAADAEQRAAMRSPRRDLTAYAGGNALAADALLTYHAYTDDDRAREYAGRILEFLREQLIDDGVVTHVHDPNRDATAADAGTDPVVEAGLLEDQARVVAAFVRARQVLGTDAVPEPLATARSVADHAIETLHESGSFRDGPAEGAGLLDRPLRPLDGNVEMADALLELAGVTGEERYRAVAEETVGAFAGAADRMGAQVAGYGGVAARCCRAPLVIAVAGPSGSDLHRAALRVADHEKVVVPEATDVAELLSADVEEGLSAGGASVVRGEEVRSATTPDELMAQVSQLV
ncbi:DUF255 domain-containing protein [Salinirubrum litoreum]|uniref:DUF255 domain-containing protein n=1 Tax=Salinirubrum litoreum TaxID=1126234 RepID=A0ABD5R7A5_9EURY|nr:DUF255 domain-containing protein [Salinirubrum litoreum]